MIEALSALIDQIFSLEQQISGLNHCIKQQHRANEAAKRLEGIPGIRIIIATAISATVTDPGQFKSGRRPHIAQRGRSQSEHKKLGAGA